MQIISIVIRRRESGLYFGREVSLMKKLINSYCGKMDNAVMLTANWEDEISKSKEARQSGKRFLQSAKLLNKGEFLGLQIRASLDNKSHLYAFSSKDTSISIKDYRWIFQSCKSESPDLLCSNIDSLLEGNRKVYVLYSKKKRTDSSKEGFSRWGSGASYSSDSELSSSHFMEMFDILREENAIFRVVTGNFGEDAGCYGRILISLPDSATLRIRSSIALAFPEIVIEEVNNNYEITDSIQGISEKCLLECIEQLLIMLPQECAREIVKNPKQKEGVEFAVDDIDAIEKVAEDYTSIEDLELSIRSYNCLKRAGINSVEKLRTLSDDDFRRIRNLGKKNIDEIKHKLHELESFSIMVPLEKEDYMMKLSSLIGLDDVKEQINRIASYAKMKKDMSARGMDNLTVALNMEFVGNPGTAKTTVARIVAGIFHEIGLISCNELVEVGRADLIAKYEGQTAGKVKDVFRKARGKVLFIDEAYSLVETWEGAYGDEAISTIVQEMENNREDTIVIFAGYPKNMKEFFSRNPGLRSRVPFSVEFKDYTSEELLQIAKSEAKKRGFTIHNDAFVKISDMCNCATDKPELGNGRFCRNMIENAILGYASRVYSVDGEVAENNFVLCSEDFTLVNNLKSEKKAFIGFDY